MDLYHRGRRHRRRPATAQRRNRAVCLEGAASRRRVARSSDSTAAGGAKIHNPNAGAAKITTASVNPATISSSRSTPKPAVGIASGCAAGRQQQLGERLGLRAVHRLGDQHRRPDLPDRPTSAAEVNLEDCNGCGVRTGAGRTTGYGLNGAPCLLRRAGPDAARAGARGWLVDRPDRAVAGGVPELRAWAGRNDTTILAESDGSDLRRLRHRPPMGVVRSAAQAAALSSGAGRSRPTRPPRAEAESVGPTPAPRTGGGCGVADWGWQDNGWGVNVLGPVVCFAATGAPDDAPPDARGRAGDRSDRAVAVDVTERGPGRSRTTRRS